MNPQSNNINGYKGVYWNKIQKKWFATITFKGKTYYLGSYDNPKDAGEIYLKAKVRIYTDFLEWYEKEFRNKDR